MFLGFVDDRGKFMTSPKINAKALLELYEASNFGREGENVINEARLFSIKTLNSFGANSDYDLAKQVFQSLSIPLQWRVGWYNVKKQINAHEKRERKSKINKLMELAKLNFNLVQVSHQEDLKELSR